MNNHRLTISFCLILCFNLLIDRLAIAIEDTACLFCHQYPGLVRLEQDESIKILHIDPERYQNSAHGKFGCTDCHKGIKKIPHANATQLNCQSGCHQSESKQALFSRESLDSIHQDQQSYISRMEDQTTCKVCHPVYPHSKQPFTRTWLNMHTSYLICETCHLNKEEYPEVTYQWITTRHVEFQGESFGSYFDPDKKHTARPETSLSRIIPVLRTNGVTRPLINIDDTEKAKEFMASGAVADPANMELAMNYYHQHIGKMNVATVCDNCHTTDGLLNFRNLGFTDARTKVLINININSIVQRYENFYIPEMLK
ncbi:MAG: hypothetical protein OQK73_10295 [Gammaproteobacteria bacterium]|nr:hypothetical protein [Gammaproteobacteria bacterium]